MFKLLTGWLLAQTVISPAQLELIQSFFKLSDIVVFNQAEYEAEGVRFSWDQKYRQIELSFVYSRRFKLKSQNLHFYVQIHHLRPAQAVRADYPCPAQQQRLALQHSQLGGYIACFKPIQIGPQANQGLGFATLRPVTNNKMPHVSLESFGRLQDLPQLLQHLQAYQGRS